MLLKALTPDFDVEEIKIDDETALLAFFKELAAMHFWLECGEHASKRRCIPIRNAQPCANCVAQALLTQVDLDPISVSENRSVSCIEFDRSHRSEFRVAAFRFLRASVTHDLMDDRCRLHSVSLDHRISKVV